MGLLDPLFSAVTALIKRELTIDIQGGQIVVQAGEAAEAEREEDDSDQFISEEDVQELRDAKDRESPVEGAIEEVFGRLADQAADQIREEITEKDLTEPGKPEEALRDAQGTALAEAGAVITTQTLLESTSLGQVDSFETPIAEILSFAAIDGVFGQAIQAEIEEALLPALEAEINAANRTKFADINDVIERNLRNKESDDGYTEDLGTYGIREEDVPILEEVAIQQIEFEELLETPAELGKVVPPEVLEAELDRAGYAEPTKEFLQETAEVLPESARTYQELLRTEELVRSLDTLAQDGVVSPEAALETIPDQVEADDQAFIDRFQLLRDLPAGSPSGADFEKSFHQGYIDLAQLRDRLDQTEYPTGDFEEVLRTVVRDEIDGDLQESLALGLISEAQYGEYMDFVGLDAETQAALVAGQDLGDVADSRLQEAAPAGDRPVSAIPGIGQSRATALEAVGIQTFGDLAGADPQAVADAAQVSPETAQEFIDLATQASG